MDAASLVLKFNNEKELTDEEKNEIRQGCKGEAISILLKHFDGEKSISDNWQKDLANSLKKEYDNTGLEFTFGIAQKWINMTVKYLYIMISVLKLIETENHVLDDICKRYDKNIDVPVDDFIIRAACDNKIGVPCRNDNKEYIGMNDTYSCKIPWSQWDEEYYTDFQKNIKDKVDNNGILDYENKLWIKEAMNRNGK